MVLAARHRGRPAGRGRRSATGPGTWAVWGTKVFLVIDPSYDVPEDVVTLGEATAIFARLNPS